MATPARQDALFPSNYPNTYIALNLASRPAARVYSPLAAQITAVISSCCFATPRLSIWRLGAQGRKPSDPAGGSHPGAVRSYPRLADSRGPGASARRRYERRRKGQPLALRSGVEARREKSK